MADTIEKYQVAGLDERERGFNRMADFDRIEGGLYRATFRYETTVVRTNAQPTVAEARDQLIGLLQEQGYRQLRTRLSFQAERYLGTQAEWTEHPDPVPTTSQEGRPHLIEKMTGWFRRLASRLD